MESTQPNGFFQFGFMMSEKEKPLLTLSNYKGKAKNIEIIAPDGKKYNIDPDAPYSTANKNLWQGTVSIGNKDQQVLWLASDFTHDLKNLPPEGKYILNVTSKSGKVTTVTYDFSVSKENQIEGFIEDLKYDTNTRTATWKPVKTKDVYYRLYVIKGEKQEGVEDWANMVYATRPTLVPGPKFTLPSDVVLEKGQKYYIMVEAWKIPYFNVQDRKDKVASFIAQ